MNKREQHLIKSISRSIKAIEYLMLNDFSEVMNKEVYISENFKPKPSESIGNWIEEIKKDINSLGLSLNDDSEGEK